MYRFLERIESPSDLRGISVSDLPEVCSEIRDYMVRCCAVNPGHLGASLGAVDAITAIHYVFNTPSDKVVFDVGHQAYAHKILTGRREAFLTNRTKGGLAGFPSRAESEYDAFGAGHSSTSISAALGLAEAAKFRGAQEKVIAFIGDGALTGGLALEGLNNAGISRSNILIILNDNNHSIDDNTGALHNYLLKLTTDPRYNRFKERVWNTMGESRFRRCLQKLTRSAKSSVVSRSGGAIFEAFGLRYFGPVDGNDVGQMVDTLRKLKDMKGPRILHIRTVKGKGYAPAEADPTVWHAPGRFDPSTGERISSQRTADRYQDVFGTVLSDLAAIDSRVVGITPAMATGCGMNIFSKAFPDRFFDVGIEEEHAVTFSAGLAAGGMKPFCNIYSSFSQRAYDQIVHDVALQKLPVVLCFDRGGLVGEDGATHQGAFDLAAYRSIPDTVITAPSSETELKQLMYTALNYSAGPFIIRYPRGQGTGDAWKEAAFRNLPAGRSSLVRPGRDAAILCAGPFLREALAAADAFEAESGLSAMIYDVRYIKPLDEDMLSAAGRTGRILTIEDGCLKGGLYGAVCEHFGADTGVSVRGIGIPDSFIGADSQKGQRHDCGLDEEGILDRLRSFKA